jgi:hypothetical protein
MNYARGNKTYNSPFFHGTGQRINRQQGRIKQRKFYPGKKKARTMKNQLAVDRRPRGGRPIIAAVSPSPEGKADDKKVYGEARMTTPSNIERGGDTGYHGAAVQTPYKKPKGKELTPEQKESSRTFSGQRVKAGHGIGAMKRSGIAAQRWRNPRRTRTLIMKNAAGLANWLAA